MLTGTDILECDEENNMTTSKRFCNHILIAIALMALPFAAGAYEVNILNGEGAESKALNSGDYATAIERLEKRLQTGATRDRDIRLTNLCTAYVLTGELEKGHETCNQAVDANGDYVGVAFNSRGVLHAMMRDYIAAHADFEEAADQSHYPKVRREFADNRPSMRRFDVPENTIDNSIQLAAKNHAEVDQFAAAVQSTMAE
jgi:tetratricopeptide (TPR) repeat protein